MKTKSINKNIVVNIVLAVVALFIALFVYNKQMETVNTLQEQKLQEEKKNELVKRIGQQEIKLHTYKRILYSKDISALQNTINQIAQASGVKIISMRPNAPDYKQAYTRISVGLNVQAVDYHILGRFITNLEKNPNLLRVDTLEVRPVESAPRQKESKFILNVSLVVSAIIYGEEKELYHEGYY